MALVDKIENLDAAMCAELDAINRIDNGTDRPGDEKLAARFERRCQQEWRRYAVEQARREYDAWLATQCRVCGPDGATSLCDDCDDLDGDAQ